MSDAQPSANAASSGTASREMEQKKPEKESTEQEKPPLQKKELSGAEKKKQAKAEKAARRAAQKGDEPSKEDTQDGSQSNVQNAVSVQQKKPSQSQQQRQQQQQQQQQQSQHRRTPSGKDTIQPTPRPRRPSQSQASKPVAAPQAKSVKKKQKQHPSLTHLYALRRRPQPSHLLHPPSHRDIDPSIQTLALHLESHTLCGSQARTIALLLSLSAVIKSYTTTPSGTSLPRYLSSTYLSPQLAHVKSYGRPFCTAQSNAVRWLKNYIATLDPELLETTAVNEIVSAIDSFIKERFTVADRVIAETVAGSDEVDGIIENGDSVLVYAKSAVVCAAVREAVRRGRRFSVVCVDGGRPLWEGKTMARSLVTLKLPSCDIDAPRTDNDEKNNGKGGISHISLLPITQLHAHLHHYPVNKALFGANTIYSNGSILSRVGQAQAALTIRTECPDADIYVLAESMKCAERAVLGTGSLGVSELGPEADLVPSRPSRPVADEDSDVLERGQDASAGKKIGESLQGWEEKEGMYVVNLLHDVTPPELLDAIVTEFGTVPPGAAAAVGRMAGVGGELGEV